MDMSLITYWTIRSRLLSVPGVANVPIWGEQLNQLHVQVIPDKMAAQGITLDEVMEGTADALDAGILQFSEAHVIGKGGYLETGSQRFSIEHVHRERMAAHIKGHAIGELVKAAEHTQRPVRGFAPQLFYWFGQHGRMGGARRRTRAMDDERDGRRKRHHHEGKSDRNREDARRIAARERDERR